MTLRSITSKFRLSSLLITWAVITSLCLIAIISPIPVILLRHWYLPEDRFTIPLDFISKRVTTYDNQTYPQLVALADLTKFSELSNENYAIDLELTLPRNNINRAMGTFSIRGALGDKDWITVKHDLAECSHSNLGKTSTESMTIERMAILPFKSDFIEKLSRLVYSPLYVFGFTKEESKITIKLWDDVYRPRLKRPQLLVTVPKQIWVSEAYLRMEVRLSGLRWLLKKYPTSTFFIASAMVYTTSVSVGALLVLLVYVKITTHPGAMRISGFQQSNNTHPLHMQHMKNRSASNDQYTNGLGDGSTTLEGSTYIQSDADSTASRDNDNAVSFTNQEIGLLTPEYL